MRLGAGQSGMCTDIYSEWEMDTWPCGRKALRNIDANCGIAIARCDDMMKKELASLCYESTPVDCVDCLVSADVMRPIRAGRVFDAASWRFGDAETNQDGSCLVAPASCMAVPVSCAKCHWLRFVGANEKLRHDSLEFIHRRMLQRCPPMHRVAIY